MSFILRVSVSLYDPNNRRNKTKTNREENKKKANKKDNIKAKDYIHVETTFNTTCWNSLQRLEGNGCICKVS